MFKINKMMFVTPQVAELSLEAVVAELKQGNFDQAMNIAKDLITNEIKISKDNEFKSLEQTTASFAKQIMSQITCDQDNQIDQKEIEFSIQLEKEVFKEVEAAAIEARVERTETIATVIRTSKVAQILVQETANAIQKRDCLDKEPKNAVLYFEAHKQYIQIDAVALEKIKAAEVARTIKRKGGRQGEEVLRVKAKRALAALKSLARKEQVEDLEKIESALTLAKEKIKIIREVLRQKVEAAVEAEIVVVVSVLETVTEEAAIKTLMGEERRSSKKIKTLVAQQRAAKMELEKALAQIKATAEMEAKIVVEGVKAKVVLEEGCKVRQKG